MLRYLIAAPLLLLAVPASAQIWSGPSMAGISGGNPRELKVPSVEPRSRETVKIRRDIENGRDAGQLSRREARQLRREGYQIDRLEARYGRNGLSDSERRELAARREMLRSDVVAKRSGKRK